MLKAVELFAGYGSQALALERLRKDTGLEFEVTGISEIDRYALQAYEALHGKANNLGDISRIEKLPDCDLVTYSFPCQDISVAGKQAGLTAGSGTRSGLLWEVERLLDKAEQKPKYLLMENVKNLVSKKFMPEFKKWQHRLEMMGYTNYTKVLNAKDYGIPQNRERVFMISILGEHKPFQFPEVFDNGLRLIDFLEDEVEERYYISREKVEKLIANFSNERLMKRLPKSKSIEVIGTTQNSNAQGTNSRDWVYNSMKFIGTIDATTYKDPKKVAIPCLTPDRLEKRQNGRRFKENGEPMFTLTGQDRHGILEVKQIGNYREKETGFTNPQTGRVYSTDGICPTLNTMQGGDRQPKVLITSKEFMDKYCIEKDGLYYAVRKLTPKECFRLMGLYDSDIDKIQQAGISNSQQYKLAGNSIVADVLYYIFKNLIIG